MNVKEDVKKMLLNYHKISSHMEWNQVAISAILKKNPALFCNNGFKWGFIYS